MSKYRHGTLLDKEEAKRHELHPSTSGIRVSTNGIDYTATSVVAGGIYVADMAVLYKTTLQLFILSLGVKACKENQFAVQDGTCCDFCEPGMFILQNCSTVKQKLHSVNCKSCTKCEGGMRMIEECTQFSDTKCKAAFTTIVATTLPPYTKPIDESITFMAAFFMVSVTLAVMLVAAVCRMNLMCKPSNHPAGETFKVTV